MRRSKFLILLFWIFVATNLAKAQTAALSIVNATIVGNKLQVTLRAASIGANFGMGTNVLRLTYTKSNLSNPIVLQENFPSPSFGATTTTGSSTATGSMRINTTYVGTANANTLPILAAGVDLATLQFDIINSNSSANLTLNFASSITDDDKVTARNISSIINMTAISLTGAISAGDDVSVNCTAPTAYLNASGGNGNYTWSTGATTATISVSPTVTTTYNVSNTNGQTDMVTVFVTNPIANAGTDVTVDCINTSATLNGVQSIGSNLQYLWSAPSIDFWQVPSSSIGVNPPITTIYTLKVTDAYNCTSTDNITVVVAIPIIDASDIYTPCGATNNVAINSSTTNTNGTVTYLWNTGATSSNLSVNPASSTYSVTATQSSNGCTASDDVHVINSCSGSPTFSAKAYLSNLNPVTLLMNDYLAKNHTSTGFPLSDPYSVLPLNWSFPHIMNPVPATTSAAVLGVTGNNAIVDWVFIELSKNTAQGIREIKQTKAALIQADGDIVETDGFSPITFTGLTPDAYFIRIRHRNHLAISTKHTVLLTNTLQNLNFTNNTIKLLGSIDLNTGSSPITYNNIPPLFQVSSNPLTFTLIGGDANADGSIDASDAAIWEITNGSFDDYNLNADYNMDGSIDAMDSALWEINNGKYENL
jgi:hypothetical protein